MKYAPVASALCIAVAAAFLAMPVYAKEKTLGTFGVWHGFVQDEGGQKVCYMVTSVPVAPPKEKKIKGKKSAPPRSAPYIMITHRPIEASLDVFSYGAGTLLDTRHGARLRVGQANFDLFAVRDTAWARDALTDHKIAKAIRLLSLRPKATLQTRAYPTSKDHKVLNDTFLINGADTAYHAIGKACGLTVAPVTPTAPHKHPSAKAQNHKKHK